MFAKGGRLWLILIVVGYFGQFVIVWFVFAGYFRFSLGVLLVVVFVVPVFT